MAANSLYRYPRYPFLEGISPLGRRTSHGLRKGSHISQDNRRMCIPFFKRQILCSCQCNLQVIRRSITGIICQVDEGDNVIRNTALLKYPAEKSPTSSFYTHCSKDNGKFPNHLYQGCLLNDLGSKLDHGKSVSGENRQFLSDGSK